MRVKRATFTFWADKSWLKMPKIVNFASFWKPEVCGQTVLPDRSVLIGQKLVEMPKFKNSNATFLGDFQTLCSSVMWCTLC